jgi:hypothetical protein
MQCTVTGSDNEASVGGVVGYMMFDRDQLELARPKPAETSHVWITWPSFGPREADVKLSSSTLSPLENGFDTKSMTKAVSGNAASYSKCEGRYWEGDPSPRRGCVEGGQ